MRWAAFDPAGARVATASGDGLARVWRVADGALDGPPLAHEAPLTCVAFAPDGTRLATATESDSGARAWLWELATRTRTALEGHRAGAVLHLAFCPDGARLATTGSDMSVRVFDLAGRALRVYRAYYQPLAARWTPTARAS